MSEDEKREEQGVVEVVVGGGAVMGIGVRVMTGELVAN